MLPAKHRLTESSQFAATVRGGHRAGGRNLVVHLMARESDEPALVGFVVSKAVGNAVTRNRVKRRLRAIVADRIAQVPAGALVVVRALPASAEAEFEALSIDVARSLNKLCDRTAA